MKNAVIARIFQEIADFLELQAENPFKIRAYQKAARTIENLPMELEQVMNEGKLREIPGIGEAIAKKISELITTGRLSYYEELRAKFPAGIITLMEIPGIGPKTARRIIDQFNDRENRKLINRLKETGLNFSEEVSKKETELAKTFAGEIWCVTGMFEHFKPRERS